MTIQKLASELAKREGKKSQTRVGDIRELLKLVCTIEAELMVSGNAAPGPVEVLTEHVNKIAEKLYRKSSTKKRSAK